MDSSIVYQNLEEHLKDSEEILFLGNYSLIHALYVAGRARKNGINIETKAIVPPQSGFKSEEEAIETGEKDIKKKGIPNTSYRIGKIDSLDKKHRLIVDDSICELKRLEKIMKNLEKGGRIVLSLDEWYIYPLRVTKKGLIRKKTSVKSLKELLLDTGLEVEKYEPLENELKIKVKERSFKKLPQKVEKLEKEDLSEIMTDELMPQAGYAKPGETICVESRDRKLLYHFKKIQDINKPKDTFIFCFLGEEQRYKREKERNRRSRRFRIEVLPNTKNLKDKMIEEEKIIVPKERIMDYYS